MLPRLELNVGVRIASPAGDNGDAVTAFGERRGEVRRILCRGCHVRVKRLINDQNVHGECQSKELSEGKRTAAFADVCIGGLAQKKRSNGQRVHMRAQETIKRLLRSVHNGLIFVE